MKLSRGRALSARVLSFLAINWRFSVLYFIAVRNEKTSHAAKKAHDFFIFIPPVDYQ